VWPLAIIGGPPVEADGIAWIGICYERSWTGIGTTCEGRIGGAFVWILSANLANDAGVGGTTWSVPLEVLAIDGDAAEGAVG